MVKAKVPKIEKEIFQQCVENAKINCPTSKVLHTTITLDFKFA